MGKIKKSNSPTLFLSGRTKCYDFPDSGEEFCCNLRVFSHNILWSARGSTPRGSRWQVHYVTHRGRGINLILHWYRGERLMLHIGVGYKPYLTQIYGWTPYVTHRGRANLVPRASVWGRGETRGSPGLGRSHVYPKNGSIWQLLVKEWLDIL